jgi:hypothetical protein
MPFDEINALKEELTFGQYVRDDGKVGYSQTREEIEDTIETILVLSYIYGTNAANDMLGTDFAPDVAKMDASINKRIAGKTWRERVRDYVDNGGTVEDIVRVADTESHRDTNEGIYDTAVEGGAQYKTWETMMDNRVREAHEELQGQTVPLNDVFVTWDGHEARYPGDFDTAELNANCRCYLEVS